MGLTARNRWARFRHRIVSEGGITYLLSLGLYLVVGVLLDFHFRTFNWDANSRNANAFYMLYSRDPHLAAVGFVWNPGTSIADLVPLLFYHLWTPLATHVFAASIVSATAMAGAVYQVRCLLLEWGVHWAPRLLVTGFLALNAMILYYGGNGMSEALYLFTLIATCRYLLRWLRNDDLPSLVYSATSLGLCYLIRNEAIAPALAAGVVVLGVSIARRGDQRSGRIWGGLTDLAIFELPFVITFVGWATASYVITGSAFGQFTSVYGTSSQLRLTGPNGTLTQHARLLVDLRDVMYMAPTLPIVVTVATVLAVRRRDYGLLSPAAVLGAAVSFDLLALATNSIAPFYRYFIASIPLEAILVGSCFASVPALIGGSGRERASSRVSTGWIMAVFGAVLSLVLLVPASVATIVGMSKPSVGTEEGQFIDWIFHTHKSASDIRSIHQYAAVQSLAAYMASQHFGEGQVVTDNFSDCISFMYTVSPIPDIFVIPNDRDFQRILADPLAFHAHYILDVDPSGAGSLAAPNRSYQSLWNSGGGFSKEVHYFPPAGLCPAFKLFRVTGHPNQA